MRRFLQMRFLQRELCVCFFRDFIWKMKYCTQTTHAMKIVLKWFFFVHFYRLNSTQIHFSQTLDCTSQIGDFFSHSWSLKLYQPSSLKCTHHLQMPCLYVFHPFHTLYIYYLVEIDITDIEKKGTQFCHFDIFISHKREIVCVKKWHGKFCNSD